MQVSVLSADQADARLLHDAAREWQMVPLKTWVMLADAGEARILRHTGHHAAHEARLEPVEQGSFRREGHDRPDSGPAGRGFAGAGTQARHAVADDASRRHRQEMRFLGEVLAWLAAPAQRTQFEQLIIAAPPRALGEIREAMPAALAPLVVREIGADLLRLPIRDLEDRIAALMLSAAGRE